MSQSELDLMLQRADQRNDASGLTGYLILEEGYFYQYFEGPAAACNRLMSDLHDDTRHTDIKILGSGLGYERRFSDWAMGVDTDNTLSAATVGTCRSSIGRQLKYANGETVIDHLLFVAGQQWKRTKPAGGSKIAKVVQTIPTWPALGYHAGNDRFPAQHQVSYNA